MAKPPRKKGLHMLKGGGQAAAPLGTHPAEPWMLTGEGLDTLTDAELGRVVLEYVLLPQALGDRWNTLLYEVVYRLLGQQPSDPEV